MSANRKWIREYRIVFSGQKDIVTISSVNQVSPLDIAFEVVFDPKNSAQASMDLRVFGLKESNITKLTDLGVRVYLEVGYRGQELQRLFEGSVVKVSVDSNDSKHETKIAAISTRVGSKPMLKTFEQGGTHSELIAQMILEARKAVPELIIDDALDQLKYLTDNELTQDQLKVLGISGRTLLTDTVYGPVTCQDTVIEEITSYCKTFNILVGAVKDTLILTRNGSSGVKKSFTPFQASLGENMLTPPRRRLDNTDAIASSTAAVMWELSVLLLPTIQPNNTIVSSHIRNDKGEVEELALILHVKEIRHSGKYRGQNWHTKIAGMQSSSYLVESPIKSVAYEIANPYKEPEYVIDPDLYVSPDPTRSLFSKSSSKSGSW